MRRLEKALRGVVRDLNELGRSFALLGGFAVSARVEPRTTRDVDLAVLVDGDADAEWLAFALSQRGYALDTTVEDTCTGRLATVRTTSPSGAVIDLLFASSGIEPEIVSAAEEVEILDGFKVPVATIAHLIAMKVLARPRGPRAHRPTRLRSWAASSRRPREGSRGALELGSLDGVAERRALFPAITGG